MPITIPIEIGDVIRVGKFKNKRITVKEIGLDEYSLPTVNGKGIMKIRIEKLMPPKEPKHETNLQESELQFNPGTVTAKMLIPGNKYVYCSRFGDPQTVTFVEKAIRGKFSTLTDKKLNYFDVGLGSKQLPLNDDDVKRYIKLPITENNDMNKPNKVKLDRMIFEALHETDTEVKIKQIDKLWWICQTETDDCLNAVGFDSKEAAEHSALTKGYSFSGQEDMNEVEPEILTSKIEKTKGVDKVKDMKLDKEKEIKLEILRIAKRVIKEELGKKKVKLKENSKFFTLDSIREFNRLHELEVSDPDIVAKIEEMARLSDEMDRLANEMSKLKKQFVPLDEEITKLMDETLKTGDRAIETKNVLITIKKEGYEAKSPKYKESFEKLYAKVNALMKKEADKILEANTSMKKYSTTLSVQYKKSEGVVNEGLFSDLLNKVKSYFSNLYSTIVNLGKQTDVEINNLKRLSSL